MARIALRRLLLQSECGVFASGSRRTISPWIISKKLTTRRPSAVEDTRGGREVLQGGRRRAAHAEALQRKNGSHLPKVDERIITLVLGAVNPVDGRRHDFKAMWGEGLTLLDALKRGGVDTGCPCVVHERGAEVCMGNCYVLVASEWLDKLPSRGEEETEILRLRLQTGASAIHEVNEHARLSCLISLSPEHEGMVITLTEPIAAETP